MPIEFTRSEIQAILADLDFPSGTYDPEALLASIGEAIDTDNIEAALFTAPASGEALAAATAAANRQARQISGNLAKAELKKIAQKVRENIEAGNAFDKLYGKLSEISGLDSGRAASLEKYKQQLLNQGVSGTDLIDKVERKRVQLLRDRKKTIAQTEQRMATEEGAKVIAQSRGSQYKRWITAGDDRVSDMDVSNEAQGWIKFDSNFSSGDETPPSHPRCRCTVAYRTSEPDAFDKQRAADASAATQQARGQ